MELFKGHKAEIVNHLFQSLLVAYLVLLLIEQVWTGSVSFYLNLNYLLVLVILAGILDVFSEHKKKEKENISWKDYAFVSVLAVLGFVIIKLKTGELGWLSWVISVLAGFLIFLLSLLVLSEDAGSEENEAKKRRRWRWNWKGITIVVLLVLLLVSINLGFFTSLTMLEAFRMVFGSVFVLFLPGFVISYIFFPKNSSGMEKEKGSIDWLERIALSFALSIAIVPLAVFYFNLIGVRISALNSFIIVCGILLVSGGIIYYKKNKGHLFRK